MRYFAQLILFAVFAPATALSQSADAFDDSSDTLKSYAIPSVTITDSPKERPEAPPNISEVELQEIERRYASQDIPKLLNVEPSALSYSQNGNFIGYSNFSLRGFDQRRISVLINGIPQNDPEDHQVYWINYPDLPANLESIEIQRGAGTNKYGAAAIGGTINLQTANFTGRREIKITSGVGLQTYGAGETIQPTTNKQAIEYSSGRTGDYAFYGRLSRLYSDGYRDRSWSDQQGYFFGAARFDKNVTNQFNLFGGPIADGLAYTGLPKSYVDDVSLRRKNPSSWMYDSTGKQIMYFAERRRGEIENFSQPHYELLTDWKVKENITVKSSLFYYAGNGFYDYDASWASADALNLTAENGYPDAETPRNSILRASVANKHGGWIPRVIWDRGSNILTAGAEIRFHRSEHRGRIEYAENLPSGFDPDFDVYYNEGVRNIFSAFARETIDFGKLRTSFEGRLVSQAYGLRNEKHGLQDIWYLNASGDTVGNGGELFNVKYLFFNPRVGATYDASDRISLFGSVAYISREPRMRNLYAADDFWGTDPKFKADSAADGTPRYDFSEPTIVPESMLDFELGAVWKINDYRFDVHFYWMEYFDELVKSGKVDINGNPIDENAPRTRHIGLELQGSAKIFEGGLGTLEARANATISSNKIVEYDFVTDMGEIVPLEGNDVSGFPSAMGFFALDYLKNDFFLSLSGKYVGDYKTDNFGDLLTTDDALISHMRRDFFYTGYYSDNNLDAYFVMNADFSYTFRNVLSAQYLRVRGQIFNLLNELYAAGAEGKDFFPAAERYMYFSLELGL